MSKYRIKYSQDDKVKYISHLDFLRTVNRVFARSKLPLKFSNGFNPHTIMTIGLPLSVGITSVCDVLDIELTEPMDTAYMKEILNSNSPEGIRILGVKNAEGLPPLFGIDSAIYTARFDSDKEIDIDRFIAEESITIEKKSKRGMKEVNIKDFIRSMKVIPADDTMYAVEMHLNAGNFSNIKPELVIATLAQYSGASFCNIAVNREKIFFEDGQEVF
ncbi:MAG: DUF2344 domain-containing protein [Clostridia bacterium]|nr:DUF2344 domain-containing protein [Clostridia bacterium]